MVYAQSEDKQIGAGGIATLYINDKMVAKKSIDKVVPFRYSATETMDIGMDLGAAVSPHYKAPFAYTGNLEYVTFDIK